MFTILLALLQLSGVAGAASLTLKDISYSTLPGERIQIKLHMSAPPAEPGSFTIDNPARIALDFPDTAAELTNKSQKIDVGPARSVTAIEAGGRTRVVINLTRLIGYQTRVSGNEVIVTLGETAAPAERVAVAPRQDTGLKAPGVRAVHNVDFRRGEKGEGRVVITLADPNTPVDMQKRGRQILVNVPRSELPTDLERRMDVIDFATPVSSVDAFNQGGSTRLVLRMNQDFDHIAYQSGNRFTIDVRPLIKEAEEERKKKLRKKEYTGERLSLNFQNIEVRAVLQLIADFTGLNLVTSDTVEGSLTLRLKNVPWDQALDIILKTKGLGKRQTGNVILVAPAEEIAAREKLELEATKQIKQLVPLENANIQVNYAKASDLATLIEGKGGAGGGGGQANRLLSDRGTVSVDERTNTLLVQDIPEQIDRVAALVEELDIAVRQVLVESRVVLASNDFSKELGVRFGVSRSSQSGSTDVGVSGNIVGANDAVTGTIPSIGDRLNVDLPAANIANAGSIGLALARLPFGTLLDLELSAAQAEGRSETVSSPRVITSNQHEALIETGQEIPYLERASSGAATVAFKKAVLALRVTPQITPDDRIIMNLQVNKDEADFSRSVLGVPPINTQEVQTQVLVNNGETVVLGGVYEVLKTNQVQRVPFFGDLPVLGALFRTKFESSEKDELLIFVTPKILKEDLAL
jgi:type IV pilus assembly protein PilQ